MPACDDVTVRRLVVVSHACVVPDNQGVYARLVARGVDVQLVVPRVWRNEYSDRLVPSAAPGLEGRIHPVAVLGRGRPQRHVHLARPSRLLAGLRPDAVLIEEEPFSLAALQWARAAAQRCVPYGVQVAETLDRPLPALARLARSRTLPGAAFVVARSPSAASLAKRWGATGAVRVVPHSVAPRAARAGAPAGAPTVGYVGRLVEAKGVGDLLEAMRLLDDARLVVAGDGPLRERVASAPGVTLLGGLPHDDIDQLYDRVHVTCVPSRTTPGWVEQFGRVVVESLLRGVPVVATSTGELPWVLSTTGGGVLVDERDPPALARALGELLADPPAAAALGAEGREGVLASFTDDAAAGGLAELLGALS